MTLTFDLRELYKLITKISKHDRDTVLYLADNVHMWDFKSYSDLQFPGIVLMDRRKQIPRGFTFSHIFYVEKLREDLFKITYDN